MKNVIMSWKRCAVILLVCAVVVLFQSIIDAEIDGNSAVGTGSCMAADLRLAGTLARPFYNELASTDLVLMLDCDGKPYATKQSDVILARESYGHSVFSCTQFANSTVKCTVDAQPTVSP